VRVLHVIKGLGPGGAERLLVSLAAVRSADVEMDVAYVLPGKAHLEPELRALGVRSSPLSGKLGMADPRWPHRLVGLVRSTRPDVVHVHSPALASLIRPLVRVMPRRPRLVSTEHNMWPSFGRITRLANALTLPLDDARLAVSEEVRRSAWRRHHDRIDVVIHGIPVTQIATRRAERATARNALGLGEEAVLIATVANFRAKKDYPTLLLAAAEATRADPRLRFVAIGQGPLETDLHRLHGRLGLGDRFQFLGYVADPIAVVAGADLFALTSRHEGLPIALLEAMALEVAPVVSSVGGIPSIVTDGADGCLLPPGDATAFAQAFRALADDPTRRRALAHAAGRRAARFDIALAARELEGRYRRLVERPNRHT